MIVLSLFDGISCGKVAFERAGIKIDKYYASEIDPYAIKVSKKNHPDIIHLGDVTKWREWDIPWEKIDILIGGSPCQGFSVAGKKLNFDDPRSKLFFEYVDILNHIKKLNPNVKFLLENVKMKKEWQDIISSYLGVEPIEINSALVSAQQRKRLYWTNIEGVSQPEDKGILLKDILESGIGWQDKSYCLTATYKGAIFKDTVERHRRTMIAEPMRVGSFPNRKGEISKSQGTRIYSVDGKNVNLTANGGGQGAKTGLYAVPCYCLSEEYYKGGFDSNLIGMIENNSECRNGKQPSQQYRVYSSQEKSVCLDTDKRKHYIVPVDYKIHKGCEIKFSKDKMRQGNKAGSKQGTYVYLPNCEKSNTIIAGHAKDEMIFVKVDKGFAGKPIYRVSEGEITINDKIYPIKLPDGDYIIRKLTPIECEHLQTLPDDYTAGISNTKRYTCLGNGWTVDVIAHIFKGLKGEP